MSTRQINRRLSVFLLVAAGWMLVAPVQANITYLHTDIQGTVILETDQNRNVAQRFEYEPYGLPRQTMEDRPGYTGHVHDADSGLVYMQQRYFDPEVGQFLSIDPAGVDIGNGTNFNRYWYANNNPYTMVDPDGELALQAFGFLGGALVGGFTSWSEGNSIGTIARDAGIGGAVGLLSTVPGGGVVATAVRAGFASSLGDVTIQAIENGEVDAMQVVTAGAAGALTGGMGRGLANRLIPDRGIQDYSSTSQLVREGRAVADFGSEVVDAPVRDNTTVVAATVIGGLVSGAQSHVSQQPDPPPDDWER